MNRLFSNTPFWELKRHKRGFSCGRKTLATAALAIVGMLTSQALASGSAPTVAAPSAQTATTIKVPTWNVYGAVRGGPTQAAFVDPLGFHFVDVLADRIAGEKPHLVGLQEVCGSQLGRLEKRLAERRYPMVVHCKKGKDGEALSTCCMLAESSDRKGHDHLGRSSYAAVGRLVIYRQLLNRWLSS